MSNRRGFFLILSYLFIALLTVWAAVGFRQSATEISGSTRYVNTTQAFHLAESGLSTGLNWLRSQPSPPAGTVPFDPFGGTQNVVGGTYSLTVTPDPNNPTSYLDLFTLTAIGRSTVGAAARQLSLLVRTESFSRYSYFTNSELLSSGSPIWFTSRDHLAGPVHSNDQFNIAGSPIFDGQVESVASSINYRNPPPTGGNNPQFNGGLSLGAAPVTLPMSATKIRVAASSGGAWFSGNTTIVLDSSGIMRVTNPASGLVNQPLPLPSNGAIFVNGGDVTVSGTLKGQVTIGTSNNVIVSNSVVYATNPQVNPQSTDVLGLIAEKNVVVSQAAPYDLTIQASVLAINSSFTVENWWVGPPKGTLSVYGGIIQNSRGPVGTFNSSTGAKVSGYSKDYRYDSRLSSMAPPFFPTTGAYETVMWHEDS